MSRQYHQQVKALYHLNEFYQQEGIRMMVLKGWALSLLYPVSEHRLFSDLDIYPYGDYKKADELIRTKKGIRIDLSHHQHTVFMFEGVSVENHYDMVNSHSHFRLLNEELKTLTQEVTDSVDGIYLPPPTCHALFLVQHSAREFAATNIPLRQLIDWWLFTQKYREQIDWDKVKNVAKQVRLDDFLPCLEACANELLEGGIPLTDIQRRVYENIWEGEDRELQLDAKGESYYFAKMKRWWINRWKNKLVYKKENLFMQFFTSLRSHWIKPVID